MSDYLSPILFVMEDESEAFWCFVALMERLGPNFNRDQNGMHTQLFALSKVYNFGSTAPLHFVFLPFYQHSALIFLGSESGAFFIFTVQQLVELLDSPLHNYFKQNDCLNYFFCFRWILIQFKRFVYSSPPFPV